jgi:hypothetical protein
MINSGIPGLTPHAIHYVHKTLMIEVSSDDSAASAFKKLIHDSMTKFASFNFAIHTLAQPKLVTSSNYFSFVTHTFNANKDGRIVSIRLDDNASTMFYDRTQMLKCRVVREVSSDTNEVYRTYEEFIELYALLMRTYPAMRFSDADKETTITLKMFKDTKQSYRRRQNVALLLNNLQLLSPEISHSDIVYTFFHSTLRDQSLDSSRSNRGLYDAKYVNNFSFKTDKVSLGKNSVRTNLKEYKCE